MSKLLTEKQQEILFSMLGDGHGLVRPKEIKDTCDALDIPFPEHLVQSYKTRYFSCGKHGYNIGNILEMLKSPKLQKQFNWVAQPCCKKGTHLGKYSLTMNDDKGNIDYVNTYKCVGSGEFNSWLAYHYEVDGQAFQFNGRGSQARAYGDEVKKHLVKTGYLK